MHSIIPNDGFEGKPGFTVSQNARRQDPQGPMYVQVNVQQLPPPKQKNKGCLGCLTLFGVLILVGAVANRQDQTARAPDSAAAPAPVHEPTEAEREWARVKKARETKEAASRKMWVLMKVAKHIVEEDGNFEGLPDDMVQECVANITEYNEAERELAELEGRKPELEDVRGCMSLSNMPPRTPPNGY